MSNHVDYSHLVLCMAQLQAVSQPKPAPFRLGQANILAWPDVAFGLAHDFKSQS
jgi:hypothetical protein